MCPVIKIPDDVYKRLESHAVGFDTPVKVITRLLDAYEAVGKRPAAKNTSEAMSPDLQAIGNVFSDHFGVVPRSFGQKTSPVKGFSDNAKGVQWNVSFEPKSKERMLGVNLEGMAYGHWPIAKFLLSELENHSLVSLSSLPGAEDIIVMITRDAWQAAARPEIAERFIIKTPLASLTTDAWHSAVEEALECLDKEKRYCARGKQQVTLVNSRRKDGEKVEKDVSPHLRIVTPIHFMSVSQMPEGFKQAQERLNEIYNLVKEGSQNTVQRS
jgi:hypothetical protein